MKHIDSMKCPACGTHIALYRMAIFSHKPPLKFVALAVVLAVGVLILCSMFALVYAPNQVENMLDFWTAVTVTLQ